jgi:hypothetical protein
MRDNINTELDFSNYNPTKYMCTGVSCCGMNAIACIGPHSLSTATDPAGRSATLSYTIKETMLRRK